MSFYIDLSSNSDFEINSIGNFRTSLSSALQIIENFKVAVVEFSYFVAFSYRIASISISSISETIPEKISEIHLDINNDSVAIERVPNISDKNVEKQVKFIHDPKKKSSNFKMILNLDLIMMNVHLDH
jgi:hypothetical protein